MTTATNSVVFSPVLQIDGGSADTGLLISNLGPLVTNVLVTVSITKCGGSGSITSAGVCTSPNFSFNSEIQLFLESPTGTLVGMVYQADVTGQTPGATATWSFQDSFAGPVGGSSLVSGNYQPSDLFSVFNGENPNGTWKLQYEDTTPGEPLSVNSWSITVTDNVPSSGVKFGDVVETRYVTSEEQLKRSQFGFSPVSFSGNPIVYTPGDVVHLPYASGELSTLEAVGLAWGAFSSGVGPST
jgi:hypothetical protein